MHQYLLRFSTAFRLVATLLLAYMGLVLAGLFDNPFQQEERPVIRPSLSFGEVFPPISGETVRGGTLRQDYLTGFPAVVFHFRDELPQAFLRYAQMLHGERFAGQLRVVGITSIPEATLKHLNSPVFQDQEHFPILRDQEGSLAADLGLIGRYGLFVIDKERRVRFSRLGLLDLEDLRQIVEKVLTGHAKYHAFQPQLAFRGKVSGTRLLDLQSNQPVTLEEPAPRSVLLISSRFKECWLTPLVVQLAKLDRDLRPEAIVFGKDFAKPDRALGHELRVNGFGEGAYRALQTLAPLESRYYPLHSVEDGVLVLELDESGKVRDVARATDYFSKRKGPHL